MLYCLPHFLKQQERKDSTRFAKGQSETFSTLEGLVAKGVKVGSNDQLQFPVQTTSWLLNVLDTTKCKVNFISLHQLCEIFTPAYSARFSWCEIIVCKCIAVQQQLSHSLFNPPLNFNMLQVDIGIPHELWDKPSAEVKIQGRVKWRDC